MCVNAAILSISAALPAHYEIERPLGTIRTTQEDAVITGDMVLLHHAAWEVLPPGTYTYYLVNRSGIMQVFAAWLKIIASDCEG